MTRPTRLSVSSLMTGVRGSRRFLPPPRRRRGGGIQTPWRWVDCSRKTRSQGQSFRPPGSCNRVAPARAPLGTELPRTGRGRTIRNDHHCYRLRNGRRRGRIYLGLRPSPGRLGPQLRRRALRAPPPPPSCARRPPAPRRTLRPHPFGQAGLDLWKLGTTGCPFREPGEQGLYRSKSGRLLHPFEPIAPFFDADVLLCASRTNSRRLTSG
jgi:hypothetical protein